MAKQIDIDINFTTQEVLASLYRTRPYPSKAAKEIKQAVNEAKAFLAPAIVYSWVDVISVGKKYVHLTCPEKKTTLKLCMGCHTQLLKNARIGLVAVWTIGADLDQKINYLNHHGKFFEAYLYDAIGLVALSKTFDAVKYMAEYKAKTKKWGVSPMLSPGSLSEWPLEEQTLLCSILELEKFKMEINNQNVLTPFKSVSGLIGIGPGFDSKIVGSMCRVCASNKTCCKKNMDQ
jgi:hypothetical protein